MKTASPAPRTLVTTWLTLVALHFIILGIAYLMLNAIATPLILSLAVLQMLLIMLIFMELSQGTPLVRIFAAAGFFWLLIQFTLTATDYLTRAFH